MAGGEGSLRRCTTRSVEAGASGSGPQPQASLNRCSAKRKARKPEAPSGRARSTGKRKTKAASASTAAAAAEAEAEAAAEGARNRLSAEEIREVLARKPTPPPPRYQALKRASPELTPLPGEEADEDKVRLYFLAKVFYRGEESLPRLQAWVRAELRSKGHVEVPDEWSRSQAEAQAVIDREWPKMEATLRKLRLSGEGDGESLHHSDDGEEGEED